APVLAFTALLSVLTGVVFGIAPALQASKPDLIESLKESSRGASAGSARQRLRSALVVTEMALALVLLIGAGLMINSFLRLEGVDLGCNPKNLLTFQMRLARGEFVKDVGSIGGYHAIDISPRVAPLFEQVWERLQGVPGVQAAAAVNYPPFSGGLNLTFSIQGRATASQREPPQASYYPVGPNFFRTMGAPILRGRDLTARDSAAAPWVVVINQTMARRFWPNEDPIGKHI